MAAFALIAIAGTMFAQPKEPCLAFVLRADVTVLCGNRTTQVTHRRDIESFAVSDGRSSFAFANAAHTTIVIDLKTGTSKKVEGIEGLVSTCGGILPNQNAPQTSTRDVVTGENLTFGSYVRFRCSADRRVVIGLTREGTTKDHQSDLYEGVPPAAKLAAFEDVDYLYFGVSPDGSKVAYFNDVRPLCVLSRPGAKQCVEHSTISDPVSVNDAGEVLVAAGTGRGCDYRTSFDFAPAASPTGGDDECLGVGYWKPGRKSIVFIVPLGRNPQWISPRIAAVLIEWSVKSNDGVRK
ncbi:MAG TPA: hypothetical protein VG096_02465 [Bryobacteraceae bacterium]|jgi:hypothetical protein|nr:hypothetical protein [Bryobacteraceae bacterium]